MKPPIRVLVVEDEAVVAMDIQGQLERLGYQVVGTAATAGLGIEKARSSRPDLVLMDIQLAGQRDGIAAAGEIRREFKTPVVFLTAFADESSLERAKKVSPYGYIVKPFDEQDLKTTIEIALSRAAAESSLERSRADLMAILDSQRQGAVMIDVDGRVTFASSAAEGIVGRSRVELIGRRWQEAIPVERSIVDRVAEAAIRPDGDRKKISADIRRGDDLVHVELEVAADPRSGDGFILFLYDVSEVNELRSLLDGESVFEKIIGSGKSMQAIFQLIDEVSSVDSPVLIQGETGTGKELVARAIHRRSHRCEGAFVPVNCGALTADLAASQFFGHRKGAFTGAIADHEGFFAAAQGGTLFLDEIGELPQAVQPALLRALDDRRISPIGDTKTRQIDFRLLAATSRSLETEIDRQSFRSDLYYRLSVVRIPLPPLRDRLEDLPILTRTFLSEARVKMGKDVHEISPEAMSILLRYRWPGNVRQLKNALEFATIRAQTAEIQPANLPPEIDPTQAEIPQSGDDADRIRAALAQTNGNKREAAKLLGMSRSTFYRRLDQLDLKH